MRHLLCSLYKKSWPKPHLSCAVKALRKNTLKFLGPQISLGVLSFISFFQLNKERQLSNEGKANTTNSWAQEFWCCRCYVDRRHFLYESRITSPRQFAIVLIVDVYEYLRTDWKRSFQIWTPIAHINKKMPTTVWKDELEKNSFKFLIKPSCEISLSGYDHMETNPLEHWRHPEFLQM